MPSKRSSNLSSERASWLLKLGAIAVVLFLHIPIWLIFLYSFTTDTAAYTFPPPGLTLKWIPQALANPEMQEALGLSIRVALLATAAALILGTLAASAIYRSTFFGKEAISFMLILPSGLAWHRDRHCHALRHQFDEHPVLFLDHCDWPRDILRGRRL